MEKQIDRMTGKPEKERMIEIHPYWLSFICYCEEMGFGEIERLKIQNGLPMIAEEVKRKVKFNVL